MDLIRPKSGVLRIKDGEQKQSLTRYEHNRNITKQIGKSINILPIRINHNHSKSKSNKRLGSQKEMIRTTINNYNIGSKPVIGSSEQLSKGRKTLLSIKSKNSIKIDDDEHTNNYLHEDDIITQSQKRLIRPSHKRSSIIQLAAHLSLDDDLQKIFQQLKAKKDITIHDHTHVIMQTNKFRCLLNEYQSRYRQIKSGRDCLEQKVNKYEYYFKQMRLKHVPEQNEDGNNNDVQATNTNYKLRILNLQKKVQTLNYIIKQYRTGNNQQVKCFEQRLKQFRPNIEKQLTQKLAQSNQKYERLLRKVEFFQRQCKEKINRDWGELVEELERVGKENGKYLQCIRELEGRVEEMGDVMEENREKIKRVGVLQQQTLQQKTRINQLNLHKQQLQQLIQQKDNKLSQLTYTYQQATYKLQGLQHLQHTITNKQHTIKKNTILINRLQCENIQLKSKIDAVLGEFQQKLFSEKHLQQSLLKANNDILQLTNRLHENFVDISQNSTSQYDAREKEFFIVHMFEKVKSSYNQIIGEYQNQLKLINGESEKWKRTFQIISKNQQQKIKRLQKINQDIKTIQDKKQRCKGHFNNLSKQALDESKKPCINCSHFIAYWGQLQNSYNQLRKIASGIIEMESMNITQQRVLQASQQEQQQ